ncbi:integrase core domain-containing protein [Glutamicibacter halophytocola]|uniref:integrase core domain-containing protein n=1 Tax=Glutamicibacter halophytocola TaxID=1933880 RepID=UPI00356B153F
MHQPLRPTTKPPERQRTGLHHTEHLWVNARPRAESIAELQRILDEFQQVYNTERPHRALNRETPHQWYNRTLTARPSARNISRDREFRIRHDRVDSGGKVTLRHDGKLRHLGVRKIHRRKKVVMLIDTEEVTVMDAETSEVLSSHVIDPANSIGPTNRNPPADGRGNLIVICKACRNSSVDDVSTLHICGGERI